MNYHKRVLWFVSIVTATLFLLSLITEIFAIEWKPFKNISIIADVVKHKKDSTALPTVEEPTLASTDSITRKFSNFDLPNRVTAFYADTNNVVLRSFVRKLDELKKGKRKKIRVAFLGDSMIEDDLISLTLRKLLQQEFGGYGVGYLPMDIAVGSGRSTANIYSSKTWTEANFRDNTKNAILFISGRSFTTDGSAWTEVEDKTALPSQPLNKYMLFGNTATATVHCNNANVNLTGKEKFNSLLLDSSIGNKMKLSVGAGLPVFGVSLEAPVGITVDNFSFRGNSGSEFAKMDSTFLATINNNHTYDLIIMQYGINVFDKPSDQKFDWYYPMIKKSVAKVKASFKDADVLVTSCADRAFRYGNEYKTAIGMPVVIGLQQKLAYETGTVFYNMFSSMGGEGSMVKWVTEKPTLAYKDYMHPNDKGSEIIGKSMFDAIMYEYRKYTNKKK